MGYNKRISELRGASELQGGELFATVQSSETKYTTLNNIKSYMTGSIGGIGGSGHGWARYDDSQYTKVSPLIVTSSQQLVLPNNANNTINSYMNSSVEFYDSTSKKIQMENDGDVYSMVIVFEAKAPNANQTHMDLTLSSTGITPYDRVSKSLVFAKGNDLWENYYESFHFYADSDFVTNGNQWKLTAAGGTVNIANVIYFIQRTFNAG